MMLHKKLWMLLAAKLPLKSEKFRRCKTDMDVVCDGLSPWRVRWRPGALFTKATGVQQQTVRTPRVFRDRAEPLDFVDDEELIDRYRLPRECILELCQLMLAAQLKRSTARSSALTASMQVLVTLKFYATESMQRVADDLAACVLAVSKLLTCNASAYINFPTDDATQRKVMVDFYKTAAFPSVLGCMDGAVLKFQFYHQRSTKPSMCAKKASIHSTCKQYVMHNCVTQALWQNIQAVHTIPSHGETLQCTATGQR